MKQNRKGKFSAFFDLGFRGEDRRAAAKAGYDLLDNEAFEDLEDVFDGLQGAGGSMRDWDGNLVDDDLLERASPLGSSPGMPSNGPPEPASARIPEAGTARSTGSSIAWIIAGIAIGVLITFAIWFLVSDVSIREGGQQPSEIVKPAIHTSVAVQIVVLLLGGGMLLVVIASLVHFLRQYANPLYWEIACWTLVVIGIIVRQMAANGTSDMSMGELAVSAVVGLAILPALMRWLNKISRQPGLQHVAVPFSLGFFVDLAQVLTSHYVVPLPWI